MNRPWIRALGSVVLIFPFLLFVLCTYALAADPVVVELFTSEGCSTCPPADALLTQMSGKTADGAPIIVLGEHVDYWNAQGWKDRFSSSEYTERQEKYVSWLHLKTPYTPQMVIDGRLEVLGNNVPGITKDITAEAARPKSGKVSLNWTEGNHVHLTAQAPNAPASNVIIAITEDDLTTSVGGGENKGHTLKHTAVVRQMRTIGKLKDGSLEATADASTHPDWNPAKLKVVVFIQDNHSGEILGAAALPYQSAQSAALR